MILSSINTNLFSSSKVYLAPTQEETKQAPTLGKAENFPVRLGVQRKIFSQVGETIPIITSLAGTPFLHAKSNGKDGVVLDDAFSGEAVATIERRGSTFQISSHDIQEGSTPIAKVIREKTVLNVVFRDESDPTYTIHKVVQHPSRKFQTKYIIKHQGKQVASSRYGQHGKSYMLTVNAGTDPCLMTCLAAIVDEIHSWECNTFVPCEPLAVKLHIHT